MKMKKEQEKKTSINYISINCKEKCQNIYQITENLLEELLITLKVKQKSNEKQINQNQNLNSNNNKEENNPIITYIKNTKPLNKILNLENKKIINSLITLNQEKNIFTPKLSIKLKEISNQIENIKINFLKKKGKLSLKLKEISNFKNQKEKKIYAQIIQNTIKMANHITSKLSITAKKLSKTNQNNKSIDISLPGKTTKIGTEHPISKTIENLKTIFKNFGFNQYKGPEIENEYYNFQALNIPKGHPARNKQDSFYITNKLLLRTHTSTIQARVLEKYSPPFSIITTGRCYRKDAIDSTHYPIFHQLDGFQVDKNINFSHLKGILTIFAKKLFGEKSKIRFRPDYFPFTSPSAEFAISCFICQGNGCKTCKKSGFIEIGGCGLIDKRVLNFAGINSDNYKGYAFGIGIERITMIKYKIPDIRLFYQNNLAFLKQFK